MNENYRKVLEMLAQGKLSAADAERILDKLPTGESASGPAIAAARVSNKGTRPKFLRVLVETDEGDDVNVRVPMALVRTGVALAALLPKQARHAVESHGVDLSQLSRLGPDEIVEALEELSVDITDAEGNTVKIYCE
jgi:hypothetical protein